MIYPLKNFRAYHYILYRPIKYKGLPVIAFLKVQYLCGFVVTVRKINVMRIVGKGLHNIAVA